MEGNKILITAAGAVSACGYGLNEHLEAFRNETSNVCQLTQVDEVPTPCLMGFEVQLALKDYLDRKTIRFQDRPTHFGILAAKQCLEELNLESSEEIGLVIGSNLGGIRSSARMNRQLFEHGPKFVTPLSFQNSLINSPTYQVGITHRLRNLYYCVSTGLCSGSDAIGFAYFYLKSHLDDIVLAGSMEDINRYVYGGFLTANFLLSSNNIEEFRPLDKNRSGTLLGEGAALFAMQSEKRVKEENRAVLAEVAGYASLYKAIENKDDIRLGMEKVMQQALTSAQLQAGDIDLVISSANGNHQHDLMEARAIVNVFNGHRHSSLVTAPKSLYGECVSLGGPLGVLTAILALDRQCIAPTRNFQEADSEFTLPVVTEPLEREVHTVMINTFSSHGHQSCLILKQYEAV